MLILLLTFKKEIEMKVVFRDSNFCSDEGEDDVVLHLSVIPRVGEVVVFDKDVLSDELDAILDQTREDAKDEDKEYYNVFRAEVEYVHHVYSKTEQFVEIEMAFTFKDNSFNE
jgi:hypothetical protein